MDLVQVAPGVYEQDLGEIEPGAYSVRVTQTRPGAAALGRTLGLVAPTAAEYRILGANEPFLAALRAATGGEVIEELPLVRVENQGYIHYQKGALALYLLKDEIGAAKVNAAVRDVIAEFAFKPAP